MKPTRRRVLAGAAIGGAALGLGVLPFIVDGRREEMTPTDARHRGVPLQTLSAIDAALLERFGDVLLPGAAEAGLVHFVDQQVSIEPANSLLLLRYLEVPPPFADFYRAGLAALDAYSKASRGRSFVDLPASQAQQVVAAIAKAPPQGWRGPPAPLLYFAVRSDAVDVVYGTIDGFKKLGVPYMAHIEPDKPW